MMAVSGQFLSPLGARRIGGAAIVLVTLTAAGCSGGAPAGAPPGGGRGAAPAMPVEAITLAEESIEQSWGGSGASYE